MSATKRVIENRAPDLASNGKVMTSVFPDSTVSDLRSAKASDESIETLSAPTSPASITALQDTAPPAGILLPASHRKLVFSTKSAPLFVAPRTAPAPIDPSEMADSSTPSQPAPPTNATVPALVQAPPNLTAAPRAATAPKPRFLAPGSRSLDLLLLENAAPAPGEELAQPQESVTQVPAAPIESPQIP